MSDLPSKFRRFWTEVWRRHVFQVAIPYGVIGWAVIEVAELVLDVYQAPPWIMQTVLLLVLAGFPVAVLLAWIFDFTPKGRIVITPAMPDPHAGAEAEAEPAIEPEFEPAPALALEMGDAERRQVTVLHCRLRPATGAEVLDDPEFLQQAVRALERIFSETVARFDACEIDSGAQELILVFGYPTTSQGEARAAIAAGLSLIAELRKAPELDSAAGTTAFNACIGVATGLVVVEDPGKEGDNVRFIGLAPQVAAWLQGMAEPGSLLIDPQTRRLVGDHYRAESLGVFEDTQFGGKSEVFAVTEAVSDDLHMADLGPLIGREEELALLEDAWEGVLDGDGRYIIVRGEGGLGKSSLLRAFVRGIYDAERPVYHGQCSYRYRHTPFAPVIAILKEQVLHFSASDGDAARREKLEKFLVAVGMAPESSAPLLARLLGLGEPAAATDESPQSQRARTIELVLDLFTAAAARNPILMVIEDLIFADPSTLELIGQLMNRGPVPGLCLVFTMRPEFEADWTRRSFVLALDIKPLTRRRARTLIEHTAGEARLPDRLCDRIIQETGGNPMYVQELTRAVLESGAWREGVREGGEDQLARLQIPANLQESIAARIDNLGDAKSVLQLCSVIGREFSYDLLREVGGTENEAALRAALDRIVDSELLFQRGMAERRTYVFKHLFIQETAYETLLKPMRRQLHARTAEVLEARAARLGKRQTTSLAHHYAEAGNVVKAVENLGLASGESLAAFANIEAAEQARRGIALLETMPESPQRAAMQIPLQTTLGSALLSTFGYANPDVRRAFTRALELCEQLGDRPELFRVLVGLWTYYLVSAEYQEARVLGERMLRISETTGDPAQHMQARYCLAVEANYRSEFERAGVLMQEALDGETADADYASLTPEGTDLRVVVRAYLGLFYWHLGRPASARPLIEEAKVIAEEVGQPWGLLFSAFLGAFFHQQRLDHAESLKWANDGARIAEEKGLGFYALICNLFQAMGEFYLSDAADQRQAALETMRACIDQYSQIGSRTGLPWMQVSLARLYLEQDQVQQATERLDAARDVMEQTGERGFEPEMLRLQGRVLQRHSKEEADGGLLAQATEFAQQALDLAKTLGSRPQALAAALDLVELSDVTGGRESALEQLRDALGLFEETDGSWYFVRAKELLQSNE